MKILSLVVFTSLLWAIAAQQTVYISPSGTDAGSCKDSSQPCKTIAYGLEQVQDGGVVSMGSGVYEESNLLVNKSVSFRPTSGSPDVVISAPSVDQAVFSFFQVAASFDSIEFAGNGFNRTRACLLIALASLELTQVDIHDFFGGAVLIYGGSTVTAQACSFSNNMAQQGGAFYSSGTANLSNCKFVNNKALNNGGAIFTDGQLEVDGCLFAQNSAGMAGGAIANTLDTSVNDCTFSQNTGSQGGAILNTGALQLNYSYCQNNSSPIGGAIFNSGGTVNVLAGSFTNNVASQLVGGAIFSWGSLDLKNSVLSFNSAPALSGGALFCGYSELCSATNTSFTNNFAAVDGGAAYLSNSTTWESVLFECNQAPNGNNYFSTATTFTCQNCEFESCDEN